MRVVCFIILSIALCSSALFGADPHLSVSAAKLRSQVDAMLLAKMQENAVSPAKVADDAEFLRRIYLDLAGRIPTVSATRDFLSNQATERRGELINQLLADPKTFNHLAEVWKNAMLPSNASPELIGNSVGLHGWLRGKFTDNLRYDRIVSDIVAATGTDRDGPALFFTALELEPKKVASATARIFLGLQLECAECHDHPFDDWKQEEFWGYAAFFARLPKNEGMMQPGRLRLIDRLTGEVMLPETEQVVLPKFPNGPEVAANGPGTRRQQLSIWMASRENPYVARAAVNRTWALLFGRGLVDPVDDLGPHNPATHPELLDLLTDYFVDTEYDLNHLLRVLCSTEAYQRTSRVDPQLVPDPDLFAAMSVKVLTAEQLYDSLKNCLNQNGTEPMQGPNNGRVGADFQRMQFVSRMVGRTANATEYDRGLQQALRMMNGIETAGATNVQNSPLLKSLDAPFLTDPQRIDILYLAALSRFPTDSERQRISEFLTVVGEEDGEGVARAGHADVLWTLLNTAEFAMNR